MKFMKSPIHWRLVLIVLVLIGMAYYLGAMIAHTQAQERVHQLYRCTRGPYIYRQCK